MARGDATFARCNVDWPTNPKCTQLRSANYKWINHVVWLCAVKVRRVTLPCQYNGKHLAHICQVDGKMLTRALKNMSELGLIKINPDNSITVYGVKENNSKLSWLDDYPPDPYRDSKGPYGEGEGEGERKGERKGEREGTGNDADPDISTLIFKEYEKLTTRPALNCYNSTEIPTVKKIIREYCDQHGADNLVSKMQEVYIQKPPNDKPSSLKYFMAVWAGMGEKSPADDRKAKADLEFEEVVKRRNLEKKKREAQYGKL